DFAAGIAPLPGAGAVDALGEDAVEGRVRALGLLLDPGHVDVAGGLIEGGGRAAAMAAAGGGHVHAVLRERQAPVGEDVLDTDPQRAVADLVPRKDGPAVAIGDERREV